MAVRDRCIVPTVASFDAESKTCLRRPRVDFHGLFDAASGPQIALLSPLPFRCEPLLNRVNCKPSRGEHRTDVLIGTIIQDPAHLGVPPRRCLQRLCSSETDRQSNQWIDPVCRRRHANIHSSIQLDVFGQLIGEACSEHDRIAS